MFSNTGPPSRLPLPPTAQSGTDKRSDRSSDISQTVRSETQLSGVGLTEEQLDNKIATIVHQTMLDQQQQAKSASQVIAKPQKPTGMDLSQYSEEERKARAKVLINLARTHHDK